MLSIPTHVLSFLINLLCYFIKRLLYDSIGNNKMRLSNDTRSSVVLNVVGNVFEYN